MQTIQDIIAMAATRQDIEGWFKRGVADGKAYMVVVCDTYDHSDYPCYFDNADATRKKKDDPGEMQRVMEVYDLNADMKRQMDMHRAMAL